MKLRLRTFVRVVLATLLGVSILLVLVLGLAGTLLGTSSGLNWVIQQADGLLPGHIQVASVEGGLLGKLRLRQISYRTPEMEAGAEEIVLHWLPAELLRGRFHLAELSILSPSYAQLAAGEEPVAEVPAGRLSLPEIALPLEILIDKAEVTNLSFRSPAAAEPVEISRVLLRAGWDAAGIDLQTLELEMPGIGLSAQGKVMPRGQYPLDLQTLLSLAMPDVPKTEAKGRIRGDIGKLTIEQDLSGDVQAVVSAILEDPLGNLHWQTELDLKAFLLQSVTPEHSGRVAGMLSAEGDLMRADGKGQLRLEDATALYSPWQTDLSLTADLEALGVELHRLVVSRPDTPMELTLSGSADAALNFDLQGGWTTLQWPPSGDAQVSSKSGELKLSGTADDYRLSLHSEVAGTDVPEGIWTVQGQGDREQFAIETLEGQTLGGRLGAVGKVGWAPDVSWEVAFTADGIDPGTQYPEWPGRLDLALSSQGSLKDGMLDFVAVIDRLHGLLRERPLDGSGQVRMQGEEISLEGVKLSSGSAIVTADGMLGDSSDLTWRLDVADAADLAPEASGTLRGNGSVRGAMLEPNIEGTLEAQDVHFQELAVQSLATDIKLDLSDRTASRIELRSENIRIGAEEISSLQVQGEGRKQDHRLEARLQHPIAELALRLQGAYDESAATWNGQLGDLAIESPDFGDWALKNPVQIAAAPDDVQVGELCLTRETGSLCAEGQLRAGKGAARVDAQGLQLAWLQAFLPPEVEQLDGTLGLSANAKLGKVPTAQVKVTIDPGTIAVVPGRAEKITLDHQGGRLSADLDEQQLTATFNLDIGADGLKGDLRIPRAPLDKDPGSAPLDGNLHLRFRQLELLAGLIPLINELNGDARADFQIAGRLAQPSIKGEAYLAMERVDIPDAGLDLQDILVKAVSDDGRRIRLDGGITSGKGRLELGGDIELDADKGWPMRVTLKGKDFRVMNLPDKRARITTDLAFENGADGMVLTGTVEIPQAYLEINEIPEGAVQPSPDVVVETTDSTAGKAPSRGAPFAMQVTVIPGKDVQFRGFGLRAYLEGKLTVNQIPGEFPTGSGELRVKEGSFQAYGQNLIIERGILAYSGGRIDNPGLIVRAYREARVDLGGGPTDVKVGVDVSGTAKRPEVYVFSDPVMEERDAMSILLTGGPAEGSGSIGIGTQLTKDLSVGAEFNRKSSETEFVTKYRINRKLHLEATTSSRSSAADVFYSLEFD